MSIRVSLSLIFVMLASLARAPHAQQAAAQGGRFSKEGLSFDYPAGWSLSDRSTAAAQHLILSRPGNSAVLMVVAYRDLLSKSEQIAAARESITLPYASNLASQLGLKEIPDWRIGDCERVGGRSARGFRLSGKLKEQPSTGEIYSLVLGRRFVNVVYVREDKDDAQAGPVWKSLLETLKVEEPAGEPLVDNMPDLLAGGVLNGKASKKFTPEYTLDAKAAGASGVVTVQIMVDEQGNVVSAEAVSGHRLLRGPSERAAKLSKFNPTTLCGKPIRVSGVITYNFVN